jgi:hypothetical protein
VRHEDIGDHLHPICIADHRVEPTCNFDYDEVDRRLAEQPESEEQIAWADCVMAITRILQWACNAPHLALAGARIQGLFLLLRPEESQYESLSEIASDAQITRAALSKSLLHCIDDCGLKIGMKRQCTRATFSRTQHELVAEHKHASDVRKAKSVLKAAG